MHHILPDADATGPGLFPIVVFYSSSTGLFAAAQNLWLTHGIIFDPTALAALFGGLGTFMIGSVNVAKEVRAWRDRVDARTLAAARIADGPGSTPERSRSHA